MRIFTLLAFSLAACSNAATTEEDKTEESTTETSSATDETDASGDGDDAVSSGDILINEILATSAETADWLEIYNTASTAVELSGYGLADDADEDPYLIPDGTTIEAGGYLIVWADDGEAGDGVHATFKLSKNGETVYLYDPTGSLVNEVAFPGLSDEQSYARTTDGGTEWEIVDNATPGASNGG